MNWMATQAVEGSAAWKAIWVPLVAIEPLPEVILPPEGSEPGSMA